MSQNIISGGVASPGGAGNLFRRALGTPALATTTAVHAAIADSGAQQVVKAGITKPDAVRNITATAGGTAGNITAVRVIVAGTDAQGSPITETLPAFTAASAGTVTGSKAFSSVTSITVPANGTGVTTAIGVGSKLGIDRPLSADQVLNAYLAGVREGTRPTVAFDPANVCNNTVILNSALNGTSVWVDFYEVF